MSSSPKKKLAIVSSYDDVCGNATYSDVLRAGFAEQGIEADLAVINHTLLALPGKGAVKLGDKHIEELCQVLETYDYVNIQFEFSLFGFYAWDVLRRFKKLVQHSRNVVVTFHRVELPRAQRPIWTFYENFYNLTRRRQANAMANVYQRLLNVVAEAGREKNARILVHTPREKKRVEIMAPGARVECFPLTFVPERERTQILAARNSAAFKEKMGLPASAKVMGLFGFISNYKDFLTPLRALKELPPEWVVYLYGSQHPMSMQSEQRIFPYLGEILEHIEADKEKEEEENIRSRVRFMGLVNDAAMYEGVVNCDVVVVPYLEVGQGMSGIASICLDLKANAIFSNNFAFNELKHYCPGGIRTFDMGNYLELAQKIPMLQLDPELDQKLDRFYEKYNVRSNVRFHLDMFEKPASAP